MTDRQTIIKHFTDKGWTLNKPIWGKHFRSTKYVTLYPPEGSEAEASSLYYFVGRSGALRFGRNPSNSYSHTTNRGARAIETANIKRICAEGPVV